MKTCSLAFICVLWTFYIIEGENDLSIFHFRNSFSLLLFAGRRWGIVIYDESKKWDSFRQQEWKHSLLFISSMTTI